MDLFQNFTHPNYGGGVGNQIYQGPFDLNAPIYGGKFDLTKPLASFGYDPSASASVSNPSMQIPGISIPTSPMIQPPGLPQNSLIAPPQPQPIPGVAQAPQQSPVPMPGQLGALANQSFLAQGNMLTQGNNLLGDNWSSMF